MAGFDVFVAKQLELDFPGSPRQVGARLVAIFIEFRMIFKYGSLEALCPPFGAIGVEFPFGWFHGVAEGVFFPVRVKVFFKVDIDFGAICCRDDV